jgi:MoaA/NifB/PqqE/SkfB family radical SAM enzyme
MPFERLAGLLRELAEMGSEEVWLAGRGEPLVHPRADEILPLIGSLGMRSIITTNAGLLTEEQADRLCEWGVQQLSVSIDSGTPETYERVHAGRPDDRARILRLIKRLSRREEGKPRLLVSMVLSQLNFRELLDLVRDAIDAGASGIVVGGMRPVPFDSTDLALSDEDWAQVREDIERARELVAAAGMDLAVDNIRPAEKSRVEAWPYGDMGCFVGHRFAVIDVHGDVHGCCTCQNRLGSLDERPFREIWSSQPYRMFRRILREMPSTGLTPPRCECRHGCGHIPENAQLQRELSFRFHSGLPETGLATRAEVAQALCRHLDGVLPAVEKESEFADLEAADGAAASRLRQVGVMGGIGSMDGVSLFEPRRLVARGELDDVIKRVLTVSGIEEEAVGATAAAAEAGSGHPSEPLGKRDLEAWLTRLTSALSRRAD